MKYIYTLFLFTLATWGCQDVKIGCLDVSNAGHDACSERARVYYR